MVKVPLLSGLRDWRSLVVAELLMPALLSVWQTRVDTLTGEFGVKSRSVQGHGPSLKWRC